MRRIVWGLVVAVVLAGPGGAQAASALPVATPAGGGVVTGTAFAWGTSEYSFRVTYDLSFTGSVPVGGSTYAGTFTVSGTTNDIGWTPPYYRPCPPSPYCELGIRPPGYDSAPFTGALALAGSNPAGDSIAGSCGEPGSEMASVIGLPVTSVWADNFVCSASLNGGIPQRVTLSVPQECCLTDKGQPLVAPFTT